MSRLVHAAALLAVALLASPAGAQDTAPAGLGFHAEVEPDTLGRRGPAVVGWLYNDQSVAFANVRIRVDVLDGGGQAVGSNEAYVTPLPIGRVGCPLGPRRGDAPATTMRFSG